MFSEPLVESLPTFVISTCIMGLNFDSVSGNNKVDVIIYFLSYSSSAFSTVFGICNFLKNGPCRILPKDGLFGGYCSLGFLLLFINISLSLLVKCFLIGFLNFEAIYQHTVHNPIFTSGFSFQSSIVICIGLNCIPNFLYVSFKN